MTFLQRLTGRAPIDELLDANGAPSFERSLHLSLEDEELRAKLAAGFRESRP